MWTTEHGGTLGRYEKCPSPQSTVVEEEECYMKGTEEKFLNLERYPSRHKWSMEHQIDRNRK